MIWPVWPTTVKEQIATSSSPLTELQRHWDAAVNRLRDSAKWMATVLGAALASVIPALPLANLNQRHIPGLHMLFGAVGMAFLAVTLLLVLMVLRPQYVSYNDISNAKEPVGWLQRRMYKFANRDREVPGGHPNGEPKPGGPGKSKQKFYESLIEIPLRRWQQTILNNPDLYLPCGIDSLDRLRQAIIAEEITLVALARATENVNDDKAQEKLRDAQSARAARLHELRISAASIVTIGTFYSVRALSSLATTLGVLSGLVGIIFIVFAFG